MADQRRSDIYVVFTEILCGRVYIYIYIYVGCIVALRRALKPSKYRHLLRYVLTICFKLIFSYIEGRLLAMV